MHTLTADEQSLLELVRGYAATELSADDGRGGFRRQRFDQLAAMDLPSLPFAAKHGGVDLPLRTTAVVVEELARASSPVGAGLAVQLVAGLVLEAAAGEAHVPGAEEHVRRLVLGEQAAGVAVGAGRTAAPGPLVRREGSRVVLDGVVEAAVIPEGAEQLVITAHDEAGALHLLMIPIRADTAGGDDTAGAAATATRIDAPATDDPVMWAIPVTDVVFEGAEFHRGVAIASGKRAEFALESGTDAGFLLAAACAVGIAFTTIDDVLHAMEAGDGQWSVAVADVGSGDTLADMVTRTEAARSLTRSAAERRDHSRGIGPHRHNPEAGSGYRFRRAAAAAWLTAHTAASDDLRDLERLLRPTTSSAMAAERGLRTLRSLSALAGAPALARRAVTDDVLRVRAPT